MRYGENDIERAVGSRALAAGQAYQRQTRVLSFRRDENGIRSTVRGSDVRPYGQTIVLSQARDGVSIDGECSCPVGFNCKHVAAALLHGLAAAAPGGAPGRVPAPATSVLPRDVERFATALQQPPSRGALPPALVAWLDDLARLAVGDNFPADIAYRVVYVLSPLTDGSRPARLAVLPVSTRALKDGTFSDAGRPCDPRAPTPARHLRPSDLRILRALGQIGLSSGRSDAPGGASQPAYSLDGEVGAEVLGPILATSRARWLAVNGPALKPGPARPGRIEWQVTNGTGLAPALRLAEGGEPTLALAATPPVYVDPASGLLGPVETGQAPGLAAALLAAPVVPAEAVAAFNEAAGRRVPGLAAALPPVPRRERLAAGPPVPVLQLFKADMPGEMALSAAGRGFWSLLPLTEPVGLARLSFRYGPLTVPYGEPGARLTRLHDGRLIELCRDLPAEKSALASLAAHEFVPAPRLRGRVPPAHARDFLPDGDALAWLDAQYHVLPRLRSDGWEISVADDFPDPLIRADGTIEAELREGSGLDWFELDLGAMVDGERIDLVGPLVAFIERPGFDPLEVEMAADADEAAYVPLGDGRILAVPAVRLRPIIAAIRALALGNEGGQDGGVRLRVSRLDAADLAAMEADGDLSWRGGESLRAMARKLAVAGGIPPVALPPNFRATLRPYQASGVAWLAFLCDAGLGGILADDMGLGKTVQALALVALEKAAGRLDRPALVVAPTSLMANWRREAERFAPDLRVLTLHGPDRRARFATIHEHDLVLTTYPLIARDHENLAAHPWHLLLLDEAQLIKNPDAATTKLILAIAARHRFCLTGTPVENHLGELWSLLRFASPGLLGEHRTFVRNWRAPIEKNGDAERGRLLARRVRPFLLRRTKEEVARDLPAKTEMVERVELDAGQRDVYEAIRLSMHARVQEAIAARGWARSRIVILDALLKLRQACCDPRLLKLKTKATARAGSAKLDRLDEMLAELVAEGRRVLVFSQFTGMLDLIRLRLDERTQPYALLTGRTRDREAAIRLFESGTAPVFLVSLKAGGTGLNLTAADTVVLYDPWWNPAVEDQAVDRAHRIGQTRPVFVHKLVAVGTIEEKMEILKERKAALASALFDAEGTPTLAMTEADLDLLLSS